MSIRTIAITGFSSAFSNCSALASTGRDTSVSRLSSSLAPTVGKRVDVRCSNFSSRSVAGFNRLSAAVASSTMSSSAASAFGVMSCASSIGAASVTRPSPASASASPSEGVGNASFSATSGASGCGGLVEIDSSESGTGVAGVSACGLGRTGVSSFTTTAPSVAAASGAANAVVSVPVSGFGAESVLPIGGASLLSAAGVTAAEASSTAASACDSVSTAPVSGAVSSAAFGASVFV